MKILVLSDSHGSLRFMRQCVEAVKPQAIIHLGDFYDDGKAIQEENSHLLFYQVPGNCDRFRCPPFARETLIQTIGGVRLMLTHGHNHRVKQTLSPLLHDAREAQVDAVLYGHTHAADCHREEDGLWVLNPGSCGYAGCSAGMIEVENQKITACSLLRQADVEEII